MLLVALIIVADDCEARLAALLDSVATVFDVGFALSTAVCLLLLTVGAKFGCHVKVCPVAACLLEETVIKDDVMELNCCRGEGVFGRCLCVPGR